MIDKSKIFFNFVSLSLNVGIVLYPFIHQDVNPDSHEAQFFASLQNDSSITYKTT